MAVQQIPRALLLAQATTQPGTVSAAYFRVSQLLPRESVARDVSMRRPRDPLGPLASVNRWKGARPAHDQGTE